MECFTISFLVAWIDFRSKDQPQQSQIETGEALKGFVSAATVAISVSAFSPVGAIPAVAQQAEDSSAASRPLSAESQAEIRRVVEEGRAGSSHASGSRGLAAAELAASEVRCAEFEGLRYCLHYGWTDRSESDVVAEVGATTSEVGAVDSTGDLPIQAALSAHAALSEAQQAAVERAELTEAARAVGKVWVIKHEIEGRPLPTGFYDRHPEAREVATPANGSTGPSGDSPTQFIPIDDTSPMPDKVAILNTNRVSEQTRTYWCGPTSLQMIEWNWDGDKQSQDHWATELGTTTSGSGIAQMVREVNQNTGWDNDAHAGTYIVLDIGSYSFTEWYNLNKRHYFNYEAPVVLHPVLLKEFFPYLDDDGSGHFQVGRGYDLDGTAANKIGYFEPWNQQRFDPSEPFIARVQWRVASNSYNANQAHPAHNIGV